jgi:hypothetical protein
MIRIVVLLATLLLAGCSSLVPTPTPAPPATQTPWIVTVSPWPTPSQEFWTVTPTLTPQRGVVIDGPLNVRTGPGKDYPVTRQLMIWAVVRIVGNNADGTWLQLDSGGWVSAEYVRLELP